MGAWNLAARVTAVVCALVLPVSTAGADDVPAPPADAPPARVITYRDDALTAHLKDVPLTEVLEDLGRQAGAEIRGGVLNARPVTVEFDAVPLPEALHRLLGDQNFALVYGDGDRLRAIKLLGGPQEGGVTVSATGGTPPPPAPVAPGNSLQSLVSLLTAHPPIKVNGRLAEVLGSSTVTVPQILEMAIEHENPQVRGEAVRAGLSIIEGDPQLRATFMTTLNSIDETELTNAFRAVAGQHAEETMAQIMSNSHGSDLRIKASGFLQRMRAQQGG